MNDEGTPHPLPQSLWTLSFSDGVHYSHCTERSQVVTASVVVYLTLSAEDDAGVSEDVLCEQADESNSKTCESIQLLGGRYTRLRSVPPRCSSGTSGLSQGLVVLRCPLSMVQVPAPRDVWWRRDPVMGVQLRRGPGAPHWVARSVQRVIAASEAESVEAVRPPGGHRRGRYGDKCERTETEIRSTEIRGLYGEHIHVAVK